MFSYSWTAYVPYDAEGGSIDPLKSQSTSIRIGEILFPGTSGRTWRVRYLSELCYVIWLADTSSDLSFKENYKKVLPYENMFLVLHRLAADTDGSDSRGHIIGTAKVGGILNREKSVDLSTSILATQAALGPLGVHLVSLTAFGLVHPESLTLTTRGEDLVAAYRKTIGSAEEMLSSLSKRRLKPEALGDIPEALSMSYLEGHACPERTMLREILLESPERANLIQDLKRVDGQVADAAADDYTILSMLTERDAGQLIKYKLASHYDELNRYLRYCFDGLLRVPLSQLRYDLREGLSERLDFQTIQPAINRSMAALAEAADRHQELYEDPRAALDQVYDLIQGVTSSNNTPMGLAQFLIERHTVHQASKGKSPWIDFVDDKLVEVAHKQMLNPDEKPGLQEFNSRALHRYRVCNALTMLQDLDMGEAA